MKRIRKLRNPTPGLDTYLKCEGAKASWEGFRNHKAGGSYRELAQTLAELQHNLCGYCEIDLTELDRQTEHVIPRSDPQNGTTRALDPTNLIACCKGGTARTFFGTDAGDDEERFLSPAKGNASCGQAKDDSVDPDFIGPRKLPALPSLTRVDLNGRIEADTEACDSQDIPAASVEKTIEILGLNVERLRLAREKRWRALDDNWREYHDDREVMMAAANGELKPSNGGELPKFFTTNRSYFSPLSEDILAEDPQDWI